MRDEVVGAAASSFDSVFSVGAGAADALSSLPPVEEAVPHATQLNAGRISQRQRPPRVGLLGDADLEVPAVVVHSRVVGVELAQDVIITLAEDLVAGVSRDDLCEFRLGSAVSRGVRRKVDRPTQPFSAVSESCALYGSLLA